MGVGKGDIACDIPADIACDIPSDISIVIPGNIVDVGSGSGKSEFYDNISINSTDDQWCYANFFRVF